MAENQISQVKGFSAFLCMEKCQIWCHWNHSFDMHLSLVFSHPEFPQRSPLGVAAVWWLLDARYSVSFLSSLRAHRLTLGGGCTHWWLWHLLFSYMASDILFLMGIGKDKPMPQLLSASWDLLGRQSEGCAQEWWLSALVAQESHREFWKMLISVPHPQEILI